MNLLIDAIYIAIALFLVLLNGFFVAAEFALVKVRKGQIDKLILDKRPFAKTCMWLADRMDQSLSACQLGITMASLALGCVGERGPVPKSSQPKRRRWVRFSLVNHGATNPHRQLALVATVIAGLIRRDGNPSQFLFV